MRLRNLLATTVAGTLALGFASTAHAEPVVPAVKAGTAVGWGDTEDEAAEAAMDVPDDLDAPVTSVAATNRATGVVTTEGELRVWGSSDATEALEAPDDITDATSVVLSASHGAALHADGTVTPWGPSPDFLDVPSDLRAKAISISVGTGYAVRTDGTLARWGNDPGFPLPETGLTDLVDVSASLFQVLALRADGTIVAWNHPFFPAFGTLPELGGRKVTQIATGNTANGLVLDDGSIEIWGPAPPADGPDLEGERVVSLDLYTNAGAVTDDGTVYSWGSVDALATIPEELTGEPVASVTMGDKHAIAVVTTFRALSKPVVSGSTIVGSTLTAEPAAFSLAPDSTPTGQWYAGGEAISEATGTSLVLDQSMVNKKVTYRTTAIRDDETVVSSSDEVGPVSLPTVASTVKVAVSPATGRYGATRTATATVAKAGGVPTGTVRFELGNARATATLTNGKATWALPTKLKVGNTRLTASYLGDTTTDASVSSPVTVKVAKATSKVKAGKVRVAGKTKKAAKRVTVAITVRTAKGVSPAGKVTVVLNGKTKQRVRIAVNRKGKGTATFKKVKRGSYKATATYAGSATVAKSAVRTAFKV